MPVALGCSDRIAAQKWRRLLVYASSSRTSTSTREPRSSVWSGRLSADSSAPAARNAHGGWTSARTRLQRSITAMSSSVSIKSTNSCSRASDVKRPVIRERDDNDSTGVRGASDRSVRVAALRTCLSLSTRRSGQLECDRRHALKRSRFRRQCIASLAPPALRIFERALSRRAQGCLDRGRVGRVVRVGRVGDSRRCSRGGSVTIMQKRGLELLCERMTKFDRSERKRRRCPGSRVRAAHRLAPRAPRAAGAPRRRVP